MIKRPTGCLKSGSEGLLNQQIKMEGVSSAMYLSMASWCDVMGYKHSAHYLYDQAEEERKHMLKIFHYLNDAGGHAWQPEIVGFPKDFTSLRVIFEMTLQQEIDTTHAIHHIVRHCWDKQDLATFNFIQWYVQEQVEEEASTRRILDLFDLAGEEGVGRYLIDQGIGALNK